jgi:nicotinamidase-related amidase
MVLLHALISFSFAFSSQTVCDPAHSNAALLVVDMQDYFRTRHGFERETSNHIKYKEVLARQYDAIAKAREMNIPIVFIESKVVHIDSNGGEAREVCCGKTDSILKGAVKGYDKVQVFKKTTDGAFEFFNQHRKELVDFLQKNKVGTIGLIGANGGACVFLTALDAVNENCNVVTYSKGIIDFNFESFIYPYDKKYNKSLGWYCREQGCSFRETHSLTEFETYMTSGAGTREASMDTAPESEVGTK